jgi:hypothetical protein
LSSAHPVANTTTRIAATTARKIRIRTAASAPCRHDVLCAASAPQRSLALPRARRDRARGCALTDVGRSRHTTETPASCRCNSLAAPVSRVPRICMRPAPSVRGRVAVASTSPRPRPPRTGSSPPRRGTPTWRSRGTPSRSGAGGAGPGDRRRARCARQGQGTFQDAARVPFDVTFAAVRGSLPLARSMFTVTDGQRDRLSRAGGLRHTVGTR